MLHQKSQVMSS